jgi:NAD(P)H-flavin reductase
MHPHTNPYTRIHIHAHTRTHIHTSRAPAGWKGFSGFVTEAMLAETMPKAGPDTCVLVCGPPIMVDKAVRPNLEALGYSKHQIHVF